jgi:hypothetical protein
MVSIKSLQNLHNGLLVPKTRHTTLKIKSILLAFLFISAFCFSSLGIVFAQNQNSVSTGDIFTYEVISNSNIPAIYQIVLEPKSASSIQIQIISVDSSKINLNLTETFSNGSKTSWVQQKDLSFASDFPIIFANLNVNDPLWDKERMSPTVSSITTQSYADGDREIIHATVASSESGYDQVKYLFDRKTGMPVEIQFIESEDVSTLIRLADSNVWVIPEFPSFIIIIALMVMILMSTIIYKSKNRRALNSRLQDSSACYIYSRLIETRIFLKWQLY